MPAHHHASRRIARGTTVLVAGLLGFSSLAVAPVFAHVGISPGDAPAGDYAVIAVSVPHGCEGSPTTSVTIKIPDEVLAVTPTRNALWEVKKNLVKLAAPVKDAHGNEITEKVDTVVYTAITPLPDGYRDAFELSFKVPDVAGTTLVFPTIQKCERDQTDWVEVTEDGEEEPEHPAPVLAVTEASGGSGHAEVEPAEDSDSTGASKGLGLGALGTGVLALLVAGAALVKSRKA